jgi:hypothetical protein
MGRRVLSKRSRLDRAALDEITQRMSTDAS